MTRGKSGGLAKFVKMDLSRLYMAIYKVTTKLRKYCNGVLLEPGMSVQVVTLAGNLFSGAGGDATEAAFQRVYGISLRQANALNSGWLKVEVIG